MRLLLDTHILLWALRGPERLGASIRNVIEDPTNEVLFGAADAARATEFTELPVRSDAAALVAHLPLHHRNPFDRLMVAQAMAESLHLCTADRQLPSYSELVVLIT